MTFTDDQLDGIVATLQYERSEIELQAADAITYLRQRDPIGAAIMRELAAEHIRTLHTVTLMTPDQNAALQIAADGIDRCPIPTHAEVLAYARELPEVKALVEAANAVDDEYCSNEYGPHFWSIEELRTAIAALEPKP